MIIGHLSLVLVIGAKPPLAVDVPHFLLARGNNRLQMTKDK